MEKVLIIRPGALGDTLMLLPALRDLEKKVQVAVAGREPGLSHLSGVGAACLNMEGPGWHRLFQEEPDVGQPLPVTNIDRAVAFLGDRAGTVRRNLQAFFPHTKVHVVKGYPGEDEGIHVAFYRCLALAEAGLPVQPERAMERALEGKLFHGGNKGSSSDPVVIHPGSGSPRKNLSPDVWIAFLKRIRNVHRFRNRGKVVLLGPAEEFLKDYFEYRLTEGERLVWCPPESALQELLEQAGLYVGHDSGVTHLAAMLGTPTVAVFKESSTALWRPLGPAVRVIEQGKGEADISERMVETAKGLVS